LLEVAIDFLHNEIITEVTTAVFPDQVRTGKQFVASRPTGSPRASSSTVDQGVASIAGTEIRLFPQVRGYVPLIEAHRSGVLVAVTEVTIDCL